MHSSCSERVHACACVRERNQDCVGVCINVSLCVLVSNEQLSFCLKKKEGQTEEPSASACALSYSTKSCPPWLKHRDTVSCAFVAERQWSVKNLQTN